MDSDEHGLCRRAGPSLRRNYGTAPALLVAVQKGFTDASASPLAATPTGVWPPASPGPPLQPMQRIGPRERDGKTRREHPMRTPRNPAGPLLDVEMPVRAKLAALWASFMFLYVYVDILAFYQPGAIDDILAGRVWQFEITQAWAVGALALMAIPILMIFLSVALPARANRATNLVVASLYGVVSVGNALGEAWGYYFALAAGLEVVVLVLILRYAWMWPRNAALESDDIEGGRVRPSV